MGKGKRFLERWKTEYDFKTFIGASGMLAVTVIFALYNGFLGVHHASLWHGTICVYYIVLVLLRGIIIVAGKKISQMKEQEPAMNKVYLAVSILLLLVNICLVVPTAIMVQQLKPVSMGPAAAILLAVYTTYRVIISAVNFRRRKITTNNLSQLLRTIGFIDALVAILVIQNTLIMVYSNGGDLGLLPLTAVSSGVIWVAVLLLSIASIIKGVKQIQLTKEK